MKNLIAILVIVLLTTAAMASTIKPLSSQYQQSLIEKKLWSKKCPVPLSRLRLVTVDYYDFNQQLHHDGELIVLDALALQTQAIFDELAKQRFPFTSIRPTSDFNGDDEASMEVNNTSAFNCRSNTTHPNEYSLHAYGAAIDINPKINPYIGFNKQQPGQAKIAPINASYYINRSQLPAGSAEFVVNLFRQYGFTEWGGEWHDRIDYQHFQLPKEKVLELASQ